MPENAGALGLLGLDRVGDLRHERGVGERQGDAHQGEKGAKEDLVGEGVFGDEAQADQDGDGGDEAGKRGPSGAVAV